MLTAQFPQTRLRRNRMDPWSRDLVAETQLSVKDFIYPLFVRTDSTPRDIPSMPGVYRHTVEEVVEECKRAQALGIRAVNLFTYTDPSLKCPEGREALNPNNLVCQATRAIKSACPTLGVSADVALDLYTTHGHDGVLKGEHVDNDLSLDFLKEMALVLARSGVDMVSPSDMMDGRVGVIREALDREDFQNVRIMSYSAKYVSAFYGPYRDAVGSASALGKSDKKNYQLDPANAEEALREAAQDALEGADMLMVKPGLPYLDIVYRFKTHFKLPIFVFHISGEYSMLKAAAAAGYLDYDKALMETLIAFKRAGASGILTYGALEAAELLNQ